MLNLRVATRWWMFLAILFVSTASAEGQTITLAWDSNGEPDLAGYVIGYGTVPDQNHRMADVGLATQWTLGGLSGGRTYYFRVYAYNTAGLRSAPSAEVAAVTSGTSTASSCPGGAPAPGWVCQNGGWLPPDSPLLGGGDIPPLPDPEPVSTACSGSPPGSGWVCQAGNWLPPDHPLLWNTPASAACPGPSPGIMWTCVNGNWLPPTPVPLPPTSTTPCPGSPPGLGWVCQAGNWLPPDHPLLLSGPAPPPANPTACPGSSPAPGWLCISGNWIPPDHPLAKGVIKK